MRIAVYTKQIMGCLQEQLLTGMMLIAIGCSGYSQEGPATFRAESNVILVPTLVKDRHNIIYGLSANDFAIEDNGFEQLVTLDEMSDEEPASLVVAIQVGRSAKFQFTKRDDLALSDMFSSEAERKDCRLKKHPCSTSMGGLGSMLEAFNTETKGEIAVVTFDSQVRLFQDFTADIEPLSKKLKLLTPGDNGAAMLDTVRYSLELLQQRARFRRHVLILICDGHDYGSLAEPLSDLVQRLSIGNIIVYSLSFSPLRAPFFQGLRNDASANVHEGILSPIRSSIQAMHRNLAQGIAEATGGEYLKFKDKNSFDAAFMEADNGVRNRYPLSFQAKSVKPGPHSIHVRLRNSRTDIVVKARDSYWATRSTP
jgi:hypothetical protein